MGTLNDEWCYYSGMPSPNAYKLSLRDCFEEDFSDWLETNFSKDIDDDTEDEVLNDILEILLKEPEANYFWFGYGEHGSKLSYTSSDKWDTMREVPMDFLRVDKEKIKSYLRDLKIESVLNNN